MIDALASNPMSQAIGWALLHFVWQGALVGVVAWLTLALSARQKASLRYAIACAALLTMIAMPVATGIGRMRAVTSPIEGIAPVAAAVDSGGTSAARESIDLPASSPDREGQRFNFQVESWLPFAVASWLAGVVVLSLRLIAGGMLVRRLRRVSTHPVTTECQARVAALARRLRVTRPVRAFESGIVAVPTVVGSLCPVILLPVSALSGLSVAQLDAVIAHELAHIRRHDYLVNLLQIVVETLLFYHPAVWWVSKRIRIEREHCCDDLAVEACGDRVAYARALAQLEELRGVEARFALAASGGALLSRIRRLIGAPASGDQRPPAWVAAAAVTFVIAWLVVSPHTSAIARAELASGMDISLDQEPITPPEPPEPPKPPRAPRPAAPLEPRAVRAPQTPPAPPNPPSPPSPPSPPAPPAPGGFGVGGGEGRMSWSDGSHRFDVQYRGSFEVSDDLTDIVRISPGGYLIVSDGNSLMRTGNRVELRAKSDGTIERSYSSGWRERPYDPEGKAWLAATLPMLVRRTGLGAEGRVAKIFKNQGANGVLQEISRLEGDYVRRIYFRLLFEQGTLPENVRAAALRQAGSEIQSDYELAQLLIDARRRGIASDGDAQAAMFDAVRSIGSDYEMRRVMDDAVKSGPIASATLTRMLGASLSIESDYELAELLIAIANTQSPDAAARDAYMRAVDSVQSDYERRRVLDALYKRGGDSSLVGAMLQSATAIGSDYELAEFLVGVANQGVPTAAVDPFFAATRTIGSSYERGRVLTAVVGRSGVSADTLARVLEAADGMGGYELSSLLVTIAQNHRVEGALRSKYIDVAERLSSEHDQQRALSALVKAERPPSR